MDTGDIQTAVLQAFAELVGEKVYVSGLDVVAFGIISESRHDGSKEMKRYVATFSRKEDPDGVIRIELLPRATPTFQQLDDAAFSAEDNEALRKELAYSVRAREVI